MTKRLLHSSFWMDLEIGTLSKTARLLFLGMMNLADDEGRIEADPRSLRAQIFPYDDDENSRTIAAALDELLAACQSLIRYEANGRQYVAFLKWETYQILKNSRPSSLPTPPVPNRPVEGKPGPKRKQSEGVATDNLPIVSRPDAIQLPIDCQSSEQWQGNGKGMASKGSEEKRSEEEEKILTHRAHAREEPAEPDVSGLDTGDDLLDAIAEVCFREESAAMMSPKAGGKAGLSSCGLRAKGLDGPLIREMGIWLREERGFRTEPSPEQLEENAGRFLAWRKRKTRAPAPTRAAPIMGPPMPKELNDEAARRLRKGLVSNGRH